MNAINILTKGAISMSKSEMLNCANNNHFQIVIERFGGERFLKENFPNILKMLYNTREWHKSKNEANDNQNIGYTDTYRIVELPLKTENSIVPSVYANSIMSLVDKVSFLYMSSTLSDPKHQKVFGGYAIYDNDKNKIEKELTVDSSLLNYCKEPSVQTKTTFMAVTKVNGKSVCVATPQEKVLNIDLSEMSSVVKSITVNDPKPKKETDTFIRVVFNGRTDNEAAYNFKNATDEYIGNKRYVKVFYPFSIKVQLADGFIFNTDNPVNFDSSFNLSLASNVVEGGEVHYSTAQISKIKTEVNGNTLVLNFSYSPNGDDNYWGVEMPLTNKQTEGYFDFHLNFNINYSHNGLGELSTDIVVSSENLPQSENFKKIIQSKILWGCLGKDTLIHTEYGLKKISEIKVGEKIFTEKGLVKLKNMVIGTEQKIIAVGISEDNTLLITKRHPIATERGIIYAEDLSISDRLKLEDGSYKDIYYFEVIDYNNKVYSPELEESHLISAEGIMVGDYLTPIDVVNEPEKIMEPLEPELLDELKRWTEIKNEQIQKEVNV